MKKEYNQCLDVVRSLPTVPCFPHTSAPHIMRLYILKSLTIYLDKENLIANIQTPKTPSYKTQELAIPKTLTIPKLTSQLAFPMRTLLLL
jgi:hypothetical protein